MAVKDVAAVAGQQTTSYRWFLAKWAKRLSWQQVAQCFGASWNSVYAAVLSSMPCRSR